MSFLGNLKLRSLIILTALAVVFNLGRVFLGGRITDLYLSWNIVLAFLPLGVSGFLLWYAKRPKTYPIVFIFGGLAWIALFPNAPYLLTDFIHLRNGAIVSIWYNILMFFSAAWVGLLASFYSLAEMEMLLRKRFSKIATWVFIALTFLLSSFGIYIGRFLRWNSWDVFVNPRELVNDIWIVFTQPGQHQDACTFIIVFFIFMFVSYVAWRPSEV